MAAVVAAVAAAAATAAAPEDVDGASDAAPAVAGLDCGVLVVEVAAAAMEEAPPPLSPPPLLSFPLLPFPPPLLFPCALRLRGWYLYSGCSLLCRRRRRSASC